MLEILSIILTLILISKFIEDRTKIPFVLIVIILSYIANQFFELTILRDNFQEIMYLMLPIILIPDVLGLSRSELKENISSILFLAIFAVLISITLAVGFTYFINNIYDLSLFHLLILFTPLMATDVVSVGAIFSKFNLPSKLKLYAEGESLFNDITAMVIFFFIAIPFLNGEDLTLSSLFEITFKTVFLSMIIGLVLGLLGYYSFKHSRENFEEFISVYLMASLAFLFAEELKLSGILAVVIAVMFFKYLFDKEGHYKKRNYAAILMHLNSNEGRSLLSLRAYKKESRYLGLFANAVIFISIANVINLDLLWKYKNEIFYVFILTTIIRYIVLYAFTKYKKHPIRWTNILTLAGMKGGLALIMIVSLHDDFIYKEMFLAITLGVVVLSIFVYTTILMTYLYFQKNNLIIDKANEHHIYIKGIKELVDKELDTGAYNEIVFEDLVENEINRAQRYNQIFSIVAFKTNKEKLRKISQTAVRQSDYFGKINSEYYAVLLTHTSLEDAFYFAEKLKKIAYKRTLTITQYMPGDTKDSLYEKLDNGLKTKKEIDIEI